MGVDFVIGQRKLQQRLNRVQNQGKKWRTERKLKIVIQLQTLKIVQRTQNSNTIV